MSSCSSDIVRWHTYFSTIVSDVGLGLCFFHALCVPQKLLQKSPIPFMVTLFLLAKYCAGILLLQLVILYPKGYCFIGSAKIFLATSMLMEQFLALFTKRESGPLNGALLSTLTRVPNDKPNLLM